ncbi:DUF2842 domain-containing protein [Agrobacterium sp. SHOUNA12C]|uniref:DUF2842 domain-containing protein n=1 Tax=Rhizobium rhizogenes NBRC 13257 TaxID=1220581 RepID=A0AA87Q3H8_RHIRH|nr:MULTISPECIES: DUF2842 domain-containing protein [Rhizobium]KAA6491039.1 DUF2842 domain-containing protein [Agrobacterium sp. ICMP 7243]MCJ9721765.1 DUF2842 domain-containing protein [Agrobacterium sp. BETTINA12B]MCJ9757906.1 DUF2842 domain-containing protein [Agrobacterium sp. SHOUNA12C]MQB43502.1 DUF2842 domain-containing protein [Rhizobium sp. ICMP 5592]OCJ06495.1 hypothetical protein A6U85_06030 [Agrobacterium sp. 13-626]OCJ25238.1 hypothetical protein A6U88_01810 [Agrobacterium sp. B13
MPLRLRKFVGMILLVLLVVIYAIVAMIVAVRTLADQPGWVHFLYFFVSGIIWVLPAMGIIKWMAGPRAR